MEQFGCDVAGYLLKYVGSAGLSLTPKQLQQVEIYANLLKGWSEKVNLTTIEDSRGVAIKHFLDSLHGIKALAGLGVNDSTRYLLDVGTGAGFPGLPLKIAIPDLRVVLLEKNHKKTSFLASVIGTLRLEHVTILPYDVEWLVGESAWRKKFSVITTRAVHFDSEIASLEPFLIEGGYFLYFGTPQSVIQAELARQFSFADYEYELPCGMGSRRLQKMQPL
ncbi:MAG: 16S rRNA (guanine(527)-N(7))-methyltransferase RsmG [Nitrospiraceae bacterium]